MKPRDLITKAREQAQRRSLSLATRDLLNGLCDALEKAEERGQGCENCGNTRCANSAVAYNWDECVDSNFTKHWVPKKEAQHE